MKIFYMAELNRHYRGARVLVVGASGFIGRWVAKSLSDQAADLWLLARNEDRMNAISQEYEIKGKVIIADLDQAGSFRNVYAEIRPNITFNLSGYGVLRQENDEEIARQVNVDLVEEMAVIIAKEGESKWHGLRFVHVGSGFEYGPVRQVITESTKCRPTTVYGKTKLAGTRKVQEISRLKGFRAVTARLFTIYGPGENSNRLLPSIMKTAKSEKPLKLTKGGQKRDFTYVEDVAAGLLKLGLVHDVSGGVINLATGKLTSVRDFVECAKTLCGIESARLLYGAIPYRDNEVWQGAVDVSLFKHLVGWLPSCSILQGIKRTIEFEKSRESLRNKW